MKKNNLNILKVISTGPFAWDTGGTARGAFDLSKGLVKRGNLVTILTTNLYKYGEKYKIKNPEWVDGVRVIRFKYISDFLAWKHKLILSIGMVNYLRKNLREYDAVHLEDLISLQAIATSYYCKKYNIPYILTSYGSICWLMKNSPFNKLFTRLFGKKIIRNADKVIAHTPFELEQYKKMGVKEKNISIIPLAIDSSEYDNLPEKGEFRKKFNIGNKRIVLFLGRINEIKGLDLLVNAFYGLRDELNSVLVIVGPDDGFLANIKSLVHKLGISSDVIFAGSLYGNEKLEAYVDADIFVLPSRYESFGYVVIECMACNTPVVITDRCAIAELLDESAAVVKYDEKELKNSILKIMKNEKLSTKLSMEGNKIVNDKFTIDAISKKLENAFNSILSKNI